MQVGRQHDNSNIIDGEWRTGEYTYITCPLLGDSLGKLGVTPHSVYETHVLYNKFFGR